MTSQKTLVALAIAFALVALLSQPPARAQDAFAATNAANQMMFQAATNVNTSSPAKPKPVQQQQVIVVPPGARVVYAKPKQPKYSYKVIPVGKTTKLRFIDHELGVVCYSDNNHNPHYGAKTESCVYIPSLKRP